MNRNVLRNLAGITALSLLAGCFCGKKCEEAQEVKAEIVAQQPIEQNHSVDAAVQQEQPVRTEADGSSAQATSTPKTTEEQKAV